MDKIKNITIIGLGLIGGSMALALKKITNATIFGIEKNKSHLDKALELKLIDSASTIQNINYSDVVVIAVPVDKIAAIASEVLNNINKDALVFDTGSIKSNICNVLNDHCMRSNFVAAHPIAGTENSGPEAAFESLFQDKKNIICDSEYSRNDLLNKAVALFDAIGMKTEFMNSKEHDEHIAYVSHLSHISSFMLGKTVMEIEKTENNIFNLAGSGFESTVRLAKSSPDTWTPIFIENKNSILKSLNEYIKNLNEFVKLISEENHDSLFEIMQKTNRIKEILTK
jgi:prephenate dehydrogenase